MIIRSPLGNRSIKWGCLPVLLGLVLPIGSLAQSPSGRVIEATQCLVRFSKEVQVPALETGLVDNVGVSQNDPVEVGSPIARLDEQSLLRSLRSAMALRDSARRDAEDDTGIRYAELSLRHAEAELETSRSIQNDVRGAVPLRQVRMLKLAVERAEVDVKQAHRDQARARVDAEVRDAEVSKINHHLRNLQAISPIDGVVLDVTRSAGEWIEQGQTIATIGRMDRLHVRALLSSNEISPAQCRGLPVSVHWIDPGSDQRRSLRGKVLSTDPQMLPNGQFRLHAEIVNQREQVNDQQWQLQPGAMVKLKVYVSARAALRAPLTSNR